MPHVAVIMPVFNAAPFLAQAVGSILTQSHRALELIAVDDGSTDGSGEILREMAGRDGRVRVLRQENAGAVVTLNRGIEVALETGAEFVAIMHADDVSLPGRIEGQLAYFAAHREVAIAGTGMESFVTGEAAGQAGRVWRYPEEPRFTKGSLLFWCCFAHPTMMFRRGVLEGSGWVPGLRYDPCAPMPCEDYALWAKASRHYAMGNVGEVLLRYRLHAGQGGAVHQARAAELTEWIRRGLLADLGVVASAGEMAVHQGLAESVYGEGLEFLGAARGWLEKLRGANVVRRVYEEEALAKILAGRWGAACLHAAGRGVEGVWGEFWDSALAGYVDRTLEKNRGIPARVAP